MSGMRRGVVLRPWRAGPCPGAPPCAALPVLCCAAHPHSWAVLHCAPTAGLLPRLPGTLQVSLCPDWHVPLPGPLHVGLCTDRHMPAERACPTARPQLGLEHLFEGACACVWAFRCSIACPDDLVYNYDGGIYRDITGTPLCARSTWDLFCSMHAGALMVWCARLTGTPSRVCTEDLRVCERCVE